MKASVRWITEYLTSPLPVDLITETLTRIGHEVDETVAIGEVPNGVVLGHVREVKKHPDADRLTICRVDIGAGADQTSQIICGAPNVAAGQWVAVALPGTTLPVKDKNGQPLTIAAAKIRGVESNGMICAEDELGLGNDHSGIMVFNDKVSPLDIGKPLSVAISLQSDTILDIGLTPNRPDASCHTGLARDLAAATHVDFMHPLSSVEPEEGFTVLEMNSEKTGNTSSHPLESQTPAVEIRNGSACPRYVGVVISGVKVGKSPERLKNRLESLGLRSVNNVVDITNEVLHDIGQPLHAFDLDTFSSGKVMIQTFEKTVSFTTLDHVKREYPVGSLFICDGDKPVALAGIMGGEESEVTDKTTNIFLESAYFEPSGIRKTAKIAGLQTDASYRFERGIDPQMTLKAALYAAKKISEVAGGQIQPLIRDVKSEAMPSEIHIHFRPKRAEVLLGTTLDRVRLRDLFTKLEIQIEGDTQNSESWLCRVPSFRPDITREIDLIEEMGRLMDYNTLPVPDTQRAFVPTPVPKWESFKDRIRTIVSGLKYREIVTNSLLSAQAVHQFGNEEEIIHTLNPVSQDAVSLRSSLLAGFTQAVQFNANRESESMRFFEIGHVYSLTEKDGDWIEGIRERSHLQLGLAGSRQIEDWRGKQLNYSVFDLKEDLTAFFQALGMESRLSTRLHTDPLLQEEILIYQVNDMTIAKVIPFSDVLRKKLDVDLPMFAAEIDLTACFEVLSENSVPLSYTEPSRFPPFTFDAAFIVEKATVVHEMKETILNSAGSLLQEVHVFDLFEGESIGMDKKSVAFRMTFLDRNKTLSSSDVEPVIQKIVNQLNASFAAVLRS